MANFLGADDRALRAATRIVAPAVAFKAEAIVGPGDLIYYLGRGQHWGKVSDLAYHNSVMVQLWSAIASRVTTLFAQALNQFPAKPTTSTRSIPADSNATASVRPVAMSEATCSREGIESVLSSYPSNPEYDGEYCPFLK